MSLLCFPAFLPCVVVNAQSKSLSKHSGSAATIDAAMQGLNDFKDFKDLLGLFSRARTDEHLTIGERYIVLRYMLKKGVDSSDNYVLKSDGKDAVIDVTKIMQQSYEFTLPKPPPQQTYDDSVLWSLHSCFYTLLNLVATTC